MTKMKTDYVMVDGKIVYEGNDAVTYARYNCAHDPGKEYEVYTAAGRFLCGYATYLAPSKR